MANEMKHITTDIAPVIENLYKDGLTVVEVSSKTIYTPRQIRHHLEKKCLTRSREEAFTIGKAKNRYDKPRGQESPWWKGGRIHRSDGYVLFYQPNHPRADKNRYMYEHIYIWETVHQCPVPNGYCIHHLNGIKDDNRPENLFAMRKGEHIGQTTPYKQKIRALEAEVKLLKQALENNQMLFSIGEN